MPPHLVFGAGGIGTTEKSFTYTWDTPEKVSELLDVLKKLDVLELDSAASYPPGNPWHTETLLGQSKALEKGFIIDSKVAGFGGPGVPKLNDERMTASVDKTLELLGTKKVRTLYAHFPDADTPMEETAAAFNKQYLEGRFERLGLSNYSAAEMAQYFAICEEQGYIKPTVYEGGYSALYRNYEAELIPLLRKHNCVFYGFSPLAGGFLTGKVTFASEPATDLHRTRWHGNSAMGWYAKTFDKPNMHEAVRRLKAACDEASPPLSLQEVSLRWLVHHSTLQEGDGIILGAKTAEQLEANVADARKGPLEGAVLETVEGLWALANKDGGEGEKADDGPIN